MNSSILYWRLLRHIKPYRIIFVLTIFAMVIMAITEPLLPALLQPLLDDGFVAQDAQMIGLIPLLLIILMVIRGLATLASSVGMAWIATRLVMDLRGLMFEKILTLPTTTFDDQSAGVLLSKVTYDVNRVMAAATDSLIIIVRDSLAIIGLLAWMFYLNWMLSLIIFSVVPFIIIVVRYVSRQLRGFNMTLQETMGDLTRILEEAIAGHKLVKIFGGKKYEQARFNETSNQVRRLEVKNQLTNGLSVFIVQLLITVALAVIIYIAAQQSTQDMISVGGFVSLFTAMGMLFAPVKRLTKVNEQIQQGLAAAQSVFELIDQVAEIEKSQTISSAIPRLRGEIEFKQVTFHYSGQEKAALQQLSLSIGAGETVAIVGASGSGKSTLAQLLPRFYDIKQGDLCLDGRSIQEFNIAELRANMALVSQEIILFNDTVAANIAYGEMSGVDFSAIVDAAKLAYAYDFIMELPEGFATMVGERGVKLSGGQRQRLAIARALLKRAPILIFDEATAALDTHSEQQVQRALRQLPSHCTTIIIAHRLSTIIDADKIVVMDQGNIVEMGTHAELLLKKGHYARLYQIQLTH
ncbi:lipid A export permease/ATP-binding protein MsbA [Thioflexithrix psekupsensis]|uniref:Lipid A export permease/ATP-binding protein MsbA n=1 Tax=Thioflexithrix psekupsensis TaxID=1570016 RepID=A0A251XC68_9GAMM|nr:lipid A export permease/ATP-binding protein MsbA [Thioflexithrix psekupsensis]OUD15747.1 lipid A export permease/ATP-binding protein MsbA [Thioflexithrix psekupsensis]